MIGEGFQGQVFLLCQRVFRCAHEHQRVVPDDFAVQTLIRLRGQGDHPHFQFPVQNTFPGFLGINEMNVELHQGVIPGKLAQNRWQSVQSNMVAGADSQFTAHFP